jgi:hypothetical protein
MSSSGVRAEAVKGRVIHQIRREERTKKASRLGMGAVGYIAKFEE